MRNGNGIVGLPWSPDTPGVRGMIATGRTSGITAVRPIAGICCGMRAGIHGGTRGPLG